MLVKYFHTHSISAYISVFILSLCLWLANYFTYSAPILVDHYTAFRLVNALVPNPFLNSLLAFMLILSTGILINLITQREEVVNDKLNQLPGILYVLGCFTIPHFISLNTIPFINLSFLLAFGLLWSSYRAEDRFAKTYNLAFLFGISLLFYTSLSLFLICLLFCLYMIKPVKIKELVFSCLGFISPLYFKLCLLFVFSKNSDWSFLLYFKNESIARFSNLKIADLGIHATILMVLLLLLSLVLMAVYRNSIKVKTLKTRNTLFALICFYFIYCLLVRFNLTDLYGFLLLPACILSADLISSIKNLKWGNFLLGFIFLNSFLYVLHRFGFLIYN